MSQREIKVAVLGAGSWGTTLANHLAGKGVDTAIWMREKELKGIIETTGENSYFLPGIKLSKALRPVTEIEEALAGADFILSSIPSHGIRGVFEEAVDLFPKSAVLVNTSKGIEIETSLTGSAIFAEFGLDKVVLLSGPTFAREVAGGLPCAIVAACRDINEAAKVQRLFSSPVFRVYTNTDVTGVEYAGALKNVMAVAAGISDGLGLGTNARAALITRGLAEMTRLGLHMGASAETFYGLSGMGDLVLTTTGDLSRNRTVGMELGRGKSLEEIIGSMKMVAEGVKTSKAVAALSRKVGVEMPITDEVTKVLYEGKPPKDAVMDLMTRELKEE